MMDGHKADGGQAAAKKKKRKRKKGVVVGDDSIASGNSPGLASCVSVL